MSNKRLSLYVFQIPADPLRTPSYIVAEMVNSTWRVLRAVSQDLSLSDWPSFYFLFDDIFKKRMVRYPGCGEAATCGGSLRPVFAVGRFDERGSEKKADEFFEGKLYTLEIVQDMNRFIQRLAGVCYRLSSRKYKLNLDKVALKAKMTVAIRSALLPHVFVGSNCAACEVRASAKERVPFS